MSRRHVEDASVDPCERATVVEPDPTCADEHPHRRWRWCLQRVRPQRALKALTGDNERDNEEHRDRVRHGAHSTTTHRSSVLRLRLSRVGFSQAPQSTRREHDGDAAEPAERPEGPNEEEAAGRPGDVAVMRPLHVHDGHGHRQQPDEQHDHVPRSPLGERERPVQQDREDDQRGLRGLGLRYPADDVVLMCSVSSTIESRDVTIRIAFGFIRCSPCSSRADQVGSRRRAAMEIVRATATRRARCSQ